MNASSTAAPASGGDVLPLPPAITPAIGIAGGILILTGLGYGLIGIKHRLAHVFFSCAYLISLSVVILIIFIASPPISDAIQGAFFVAACISGLIVGGLSLIFKDITEGFGCLLGGFCIAMWIMTLRAGGLIHSQGGTAAFIIIISAAFFALSFSRYTKYWSLIASSAFSGATVTILGVDCFSEAGLKEFWMYIWGLNDKFFPYDITTYPLTRGIRVEIGCIPVLFLFGLISQLSVWKVVKERRDQKEAERVRHNEDHEKFETDVGRRIAEATSKDLRVWEATYGDEKSSHGSHTNAGPTSPSSRTHKRSRSDNFSPIERSATKHSYEQKTNPLDNDEISVLPNVNPMVSTREASDDSVQRSKLESFDGRRHSASLRKDLPSLRPKSVPPPPFTEEPELLNDLEGDQHSEAGSSSRSFVGLDTEPAWISTSPEFPTFWSSEAESEKDYVQDDRFLRKDSRVEAPGSATYTTQSKSITTDNQQEQTDEDKLFDFEHIQSGDEVESIQNSKAAEEDMRKTRLEQNTRRSSNQPSSSHTGVKREELEGFSHQEPKKVALHRTNEWTKLLDGAEEPSLEDEQRTDCKSSICTSDHERIEQAENLWTGFEGTHLYHTSTSTLASIQAPQKVVKKPSNLVRKSRGIKPTTTVPSTPQPKNPILPPSVKSARVHQHNASLPALHTTPVSTLKPRRQSATTNSTVSTPQNSTYQNSGVSTRPTSGDGDDDGDGDGDDMTLSARRKSLQAQLESTHASTVSSASATQTPNTVYTPSSPVYPVFAMTALPLRVAYPVPVLPPPSRQISPQHGPSQHTPRSHIHTQQSLYTVLQERNRNGKGSGTGNGKQKQSVHKSAAEKSFEAQKRKMEGLDRKGGLEGAHKEALGRMQRGVDVGLGG